MTPTNTIKVDNTAEHQVENIDLEAAYLVLIHSYVRRKFLDQQIAPTSVQASSCKS